MPKQYNLFISHSWTYADKYDRLVEMLDESGINYKNYSVPKDDPIHNAPNASELAKAIDRQIAPCTCVLIMAGVYATYSKWINKEIEIAKRYGKPIIAITPWGNQNISSVVRDAAFDIVKWQTNSIKAAIQKY